MDQNQIGAGSTGVGYGGFWVRLIAYIIDVLIIGIPMAVIAGILSSMALASLSTMREAGVATGMPITLIIMPFILYLVIPWLYFAIMESSKIQATVGKLTFGLKVTGTQGNKISFGRATGRYFAKMISALIFFIGFIIIGFTDKKRGLHDMIAGTLVVKKQN